MIHTTDAQARANFRRLLGPEVLIGRHSVHGGGGHVRAPSIVAYRAARSQICAGADGDVSDVSMNVKEGSAGCVSGGLGAVAGLVWLTCNGF